MRSDQEIREAADVFWNDAQSLVKQAWIGDDIDAKSRFMASAAIESALRWAIGEETDTSLGFARFLGKLKDSNNVGGA